MLGPGRLLSLTVVALSLIPTTHAFKNLNKLRERQNAALKAHMESIRVSVLAQKPNGTAPGVQNITFSNPKASGVPSFRHQESCLMCRMQLSMSTANLFHWSISMLDPVEQGYCQSVEPRTRLERYVA